MAERTLDPFRVEWCESPRLWLDQILAVPAEQGSSPTAEFLKARRAWIATHHQVLSMAERFETESRRSSLFMTLHAPSEVSKSRSLLSGVVLPAGRVYLISRPHSESVLDEGLARYAFQRFHIESVLGERKHTERLIQLAGKNVKQISNRQTAWEKNPISAELQMPMDNVEVRRAQESDRLTLIKWADGFGSETGASSREEVLEWMKRGKLFVFSLRDPAFLAPQSSSTHSAKTISKLIGMAAYSGDFRDRYLGRSQRISLLYIIPEMRRQGLGKSILRILELESKMESTSSVVLFSDSTQARAASFYSLAGFLPVGEIAEFSVRTTG